MYSCTWARKYKHPLLMACVKSMANGSNSTLYFSMMCSVDPFTYMLKLSAMRPVAPEVRKRVHAHASVHMYAQGHVHMYHTLIVCARHIANMFLTIHQISV